MKRKSIWICLILLLIASSYISLLWLKSCRSPQFLGRCIRHIEISERVVALTFDDGPSFYTQEILDILRLYKIQATFFLLGQNIEQFPVLIQQIYKEGYEIGNHRLILINGILSNVGSLPMQCPNVLRFIPVKTSEFLVCCYFFKFHHSWI